MASRSNQARTTNLNDPSLINIVADEWAVVARTPSVGVEGARIVVHFDQLQARLIEYIHQADAVVGCVAWLTSETILSALSEKAMVSLLIQKEDFLRPDLENRGSSWKSKLREMYGSLPSSDIDRISINGQIVNQLSYASGYSPIDPIRCVGFAGKESARPRMHHKFLVFCRIEATSADASEMWWESDNHPELVPYAVWTGSFNFTQMAANSLENAVYIGDARAAEQFYQEWEYVFALSEPLDWEHEYCAPEYRIGT